MSKRQSMPDCYDYVRRYYGVEAFVGRRVLANHRGQHRQGTLAKTSIGHYLYILFDGDKRPTGPFHPTDGIEYLPVSGPRQTDDEETQKERA